MRNSTIRTISKLLCVILIASFTMQAPLMAAYSGIKLNVGSKSINVTPGQWVTVNNGGTTTQYNVRYVNGKPMALNLKQFTKIVFGGDSAAAAAAAPSISNADSVVTTPKSTGFLSRLGSKITSLFKGRSAKTSTSPVSSKVSVSPTSGKTSGSFLKNEIKSYGKNISLGQCK